MTREISATPAGTWHILSAQDACEALSADASKGLPSAEAAARLARYGENRLTETRPRPI
jgi:Ca2+-transporting ATPase